LALTKQNKDDIVAELVDLLKQANGFVIIQHAGMGTQQIDQLRAKVREAQGKYVVAKNTLLTKALEQVGWPVPETHLTGPTAIAFGMSNFPGVAKAVLDFVSAPEFAEKIGVKGGVMDAEILDAKQVDTISKLPTLDELRSQIIGVIVAPATGIVSVIQAATGSIINVLQALEDKDKDGGETAA